MKTAVCTYCDGDYHYGAGVLINSLYQQGYRGTVWAGYRGALPPWAKPLTQGDGYWEYVPVEGCSVRLVEIKTDMHPSLYRPTFMEQIWDRFGQDWESLFFFDPDIVNKCRWDFYEWWVSQGIALCGDHWYHVPSNHPTRLAWKKFAEDHGFPCQRHLEHHFNGGFIGIPRASKSMLQTWQKLITLAAEAGYLNLKNINDPQTYTHYPYFPHDQTALNLTLMLIDDPLSTVAPDGMDFTFVGDIMSHAIGSQVKPWRKTLLGSALQGIPPSSTDKLFWQHTQTPIPVYSLPTLRWKRLTLLLGTAIGRFIRRS
jgi:hypothetical protein